MEKITGDFKDELIQYRMDLGIYPVEVYDPVTNMTSYWIMKENEILASDSSEIMAFVKLGECVEKALQDNNK